MIWQTKLKEFSLFVQSDHLQPTVFHQLFDEPVVAIVGTRRMTPYGRLVTTKLATQLARSGVIIISGFMYGVDQTAMQAALAAGGKTIGVLGYGFESMPRRDQHLFDQMLKQGATFITEYEPKTPPQKWTFVQRNRIIAGLAQATVVTEAAQKSGSLITAQCALDYGKEVCAVPGPITSAFTEGTKSLLNQGASLVSSGQDVLEVIGLAGQLHFSRLSQVASTPKKVMTDDISRAIYDYLETMPAHVDDLLTTLQSNQFPNLTSSEILTALTNLELHHYVKQVSGRWHVQ